MRFKLAYYVVNARYKSHNIRRYVGVFPRTKQGRLDALLYKKKVEDEDLALWKHDFKGCSTSQLANGRKRLRLKII